MLSKEFKELLKPNLPLIKMENGRLYLPFLTRDQLIYFKDALSDDLLDGNIPHRKAIRADVVSAAHIGALDVITPIRGCNRSFIEIASAFDNIIFPPIPSMPDNYIDYYSATATESVTSTSFYYVGAGYDSKIKTLVKDVSVCEFTSELGYVKVSISEGTGIRNYIRNTPHADDASGYKPLHTIYDLSKYCVIRTRLEGDAIVFTYKQDIEESVLFNILMKYLMDGGGVS